MIKLKVLQVVFKLSNIKKYIDSIIEDVVLCPNCRSPELSIPDVIKKEKKIRIGVYHILVMVVDII